MSLPDQTPKLPKLPFLIGDACLLLAAAYIVDRSATPLSSHAVAAITACVAGGALLGAIPFLSDYARKQDEALDERQRGLEALSRTINTAAEQISIAANGLNELTDLTHKNLKHAEQLPHKLQDKIAEFTAQLENAREDEREELEKEIAELRASETERLQAVADKIHKAVAELAALDVAAQKHVTARTQLVERASDTIAKSQSDSAIALADAVAAVSKELGAAQAKAVAEIDAKLAERTALAVAAIAAAPLPQFTAGIAAPASGTPTAGAPAVADDQGGTASAPATTAAEVASPPRRPRKARREEPPASETAAADTTEAPAPSTDAPQVAASPIDEIPAATINEAAPVLAAEPPPVPVDTIPEVEPVAPTSADPFDPAPATVAPEVSAPAVSPGPETPDVAPSAETTGSPEAPAGSAEAERPAKKRSKKVIQEDAPDIALNPATDDLFTGAGDDSQASADPEERVLSSDGATRLIATAYIGIGNRLFIRGDGAGLSWEKGVPLQFVSIGKWRWETADAAAPIQFKLYKNDDVECVSVGTRTLDPGHQHEVIAKF